MAVNYAVASIMLHVIVENVFVNPNGLVIVVIVRHQNPHALHRPMILNALVTVYANVVDASVVPIFSVHSVKQVQRLAMHCVATMNHAYDAC